MKFYNKIKMEDTIDFKRILKTVSTNKIYAKKFLNTMRLCTNINTDNEKVIKKLLNSCDYFNKKETLFLKSLMYHTLKFINTSKNYSERSLKYLEKLIKISPKEDVNYIYYIKENGVNSNILLKKPLSHVYSIAMYDAFKKTNRPNFLDNYFYFKYVNSDSPIKIKEYMNEVLEYSCDIFPTSYSTFIEIIIQEGKIKKALKILKILSKVKYMEYYTDMLFIAGLLLDNSNNINENLKFKVDRIINDILDVCEKNIPIQTNILTEKLKLR